MSEASLDIYLLRAIAIFGVGLIAMFVALKLSPAFGLLDHPNSRSAHATAMPRGGGVGIFMGFLFALWLFGFPFSLYIFFSVALVFVIGVLDDRHDIRPKVKLIGLLLASTLLYGHGFGFHTLGEYFGISFELGFFAPLFFIFAIAGFSNALNLIDGLDGLAASVSIVILASLAYVGYKYNDFFLFYGALSLMLPLGAFLVLNWYPAKMFMGDSGSLVIGFWIAMLSAHALKYVPAAAILFLAAIPVLDTIMVSLKRVRLGVSPFRADKRHIHHILLRLYRGNVTAVVKVLIVMQLFFCLLGLGFKARDELVIVGLFLMSVFIFYKLLYPKSRGR